MKPIRHACIACPVLLEARTVQLDIIDADLDAQPDPQLAGKTDAIHKIFAQNYRLLRRPD
jgi:hypothetical protein